MLVFFPLALAAVAAAQTLSPSVQHAKRTHLPAGWSRVRRHASDAVLPLRFGLTQPNTDMNTLEALLNDVSHPESPNYGMHWTPARVAEHFAPSDEAIHAVTSWIADNGLAKERVRVSKTKGWVMLNASVAETEALLNTEYHVFVHESSGKEHVACDEYNLPAHIIPHVAVVTPSIDFNAILTKRSSGTTSTHITIGQPGAGTVSPKLTTTISTILTELEDCDKQITPACLRALYGFVYTPLAAKKNSYGIVEYTPQAYRPADLDMFAKNFSSIGPSLVGSRPVLKSIDGGVVQNETASFGVNGESNLDLQYAMNLVTGYQNITLYQTGDLEMGASFNNLLDALDGSYCTFEGGDDPENDGIYPDTLPGGYQGDDCGTIKPANVISTSYGYDEASLSFAYSSRQCAEYAKLGLMGVTVLYSSGDNGVAGNDGCLTPDGSESEDGKIFNPSFPSTCPFVTSVGATQVNPGAQVTDPESACDQVIFSGGGFSNYFAIPDYQKGAVAAYLSANPPPYAATIYNSTGGSRAYPDISANGANYVVAVDNAFGLVYGTSASSPVVGAILTMVNDQRIFWGKKPIGFINPTIYSPAFKGAFNDITNGTNPGCGTVGFSAAKGYDPVTGLGTPNFPKLLALWLLLP
ncbi:subtilisin-like protein [Mycena maculata]|uniref:tripeptidyl-peptidase II n=1 Tax=Mycena maculata TaxID=230809 RepID=A0AAD7HAC5_9AGAR|nr:subtilisin-like protein [Mycena maculata]